MPKKKPKKVYNTKPTAKQKKAFDKTLENLGNRSKALKEAGYSEATADKAAKTITESKGWTQLLEEHLSDEKLQTVHQALIDKKETFVIDKKITQTDQPHSDVRFGLDMAYKLKKKYDETIKLKIESLSDEELDAKGEAAVEAFFRRLLDLRSREGKEDNGDSSGEVHTEWKM